MFKDVLRRNGMRMKYEVGHSATMIKGVVPSDRIDYLFRSLLALMNERTVGDAEWGYYLEGEQLRQVAGTASGSGACLSDGFSDKAEEFFRTLSGNVNNGIMILVGDIDEKALKTVLMTYAGGFRTTEKTFTRTQTSSRNLTGMNGSRRLSSRSAVTVSLSAPIALTAENYYTAAVATMVLRRHFARELAGKGMYVDAECECRRFPQESVMMRVSISEADIDGFASGTSRYSYKEAVSVMKSVFDDMESIPVDESLLSTYRYRIERQVVAWKNRPEYWVNALNLRYLGGKDFTTGAEAKINAITGGQVRAMLSTLCGDSKIEYVITGKQEE